jgi:WD40 repeat protein
MSSRLALTAVFAFGSTVAFASEVRTDRNGDPLPEGAVVRFGFARLLHGGVLHLEFSPDGKALASSGYNGARLWDLATGKTLPCTHLPEWGHTVFTFTPDGGHLLGDADGCRLLDPETGKIRRSWRNGNRVPARIVVASDGKTAVVAWQEGGVTMHNLTQGRKRDDWKIADDTATFLCLSADGSRLAYVKRTTNVESICLWDARRGKLLHTYAPEELKKHWLNALCLSRDGRQLAGSWGGNVRLWDTQSHAPIKDFVSPKAQAVFLRFSADGTELLGVSKEKQVWRWSAATGKELAYSHSPKTESGSFYHFTLAPDGRTVAAVDNAALRLWDAATWKELVTVERWPSWKGVTFIQPGIVATYTAGREQGEVIAFWKMNDGRLLRKHGIAVPHDGWWRREMSPDGKLIAVSNEKGVLLFDVESGKEVRRLNPPRRNDEGAKFAFSPDGKTIVTNDYPRGLMIWDVATGKSLRKLAGDSSGVMAFSPDGRCVASAFVGLFYLTEVASGKARFRLPLATYKERGGSPDVVERIRFARNGRFAVSISEEDLYVFTTDRGRTLLHLHRGEEGRFWDNASDLSPDGRWLARADDRHYAVSVHDLNNPQAASEYQTLFTRAGRVNAVAFAPDGKYLVSCHSDGTALVWDTRALTGKPKLLPKPKPPAPEIGALEAPGMEEYWAGLAESDAGRAALAMAAMIELFNDAVPLLKSKLKPAEAPPAGRVEQLIADLDNDTFAVRQKALKELERLAEQAAPALRKTLESKPSVEVARQVKRLLKEVEGPTTNPEQLRQLRAVEVLERMGTLEARKVLETLAEGAASAKLTQEAKASLQRWPTR